MSEQTATIVHRAAGGRGSCYHSNPDCRFIDESVTSTYRLAVAQGWDNLRRCEAGDCTW